jgi:hypothetical protein
MSISMDARKEVSETLCRRYRKATKKQKGGILDYTVKVTGWCRKHAAAVLCGKAAIPKCRPKKKSGVRPPDKRGRKPKYGIKHKAILKKVGAVLDFSSSVRVKAGYGRCLGVAGAMWAP